MATAAKLLLAEDSLTIQKVFELTFRNSGVSLTMVDNGVDAVRLANEISPDIVVADVSLPGKDGFHVASELRSPGGAVPCPVLILAGTLSPFDEDRFKNCGANGVLFKPFESQELLDKVEAMIRGARKPVSSAVEKEQLPSTEEEPWDFSDVLSEAEKEAGEESVSRPGVADERAGIAAESVEKAGSALALGDFDVSLEDIEAQPEQKEAEGEREPARQEEKDRLPPPPVVTEEKIPAAEHLEEWAFEESPPPVTDLGPAFESVEELEDTDFVETIEPPEEVVHRAPLSEAPPAPPSPAFPETGAPEVKMAPVPPAPPEETRISEQELRELFSERAQEIFEKVAAETVEKVMWEVVEKLTKEFTEKIRDSVENVAWEVIPATTEALIREEIARLRKKAGKESS